MGEGKQGVAMVEMTKGMMGQTQNPITQLQTKFNELETGFKAWLAQPSIPVGAAIVTATSAAMGAAKGAAIGGFLEFLRDVSVDAPTLTPIGSSQQMAPTGFMEFFAVTKGANAGITCVMRRVRGKEDVQSSMVAAFGSGATYSLVKGDGAQTAVTVGLLFALVQGGLFKLGEKFSKPQVEDVLFNKTRSMLSSLGLQNYEKNFKKGLLTDNTLPLLTDRALREVRIPPGPRLIILDSIQKDPALKETREAFS